MKEDGVEGAVHAFVGMAHVTGRGRAAFGVPFDKH